MLGGECASDELFLLNLSKGEINASWILIETEGPTPGGRYGHSISYTKPYIVIFGGYFKGQPVNDTWILSIEDMPFRWKKVESNYDVPSPRVYHSMTVCSSGKAAGMIVLFGGRGKDQTPLDDTWGLRKHRNGQWEWIRAPSNSKITPTARFQVHSYDYI